MPDTIPIDPARNNHTVGVTLVGTRYFFVKKWNSEDAAWYIDVLNEDRSPIALGIKVVLGVTLGRRSMQPFFQNHLLYADDTSGKGQDATYDDFGEGARVVLVHYTLEDAKGRVS